MSSIRRTTPHARSCSRCPASTSLCSAAHELGGERAPALVRDVSREGDAHCVAFVGAAEGEPAAGMDEPPGAAADLRLACEGAAVAARAADAGACAGERNQVDGAAGALDRAGAGEVDAWRA